MQRFGASTWQENPPAKFMRKRNRNRAFGESGGGSDQAAGAAGTKEWNVFRIITALSLASASALASASSPAALSSNASWWERVTVTVTDDGKTQSCRYETSLQPTSAKECTAASVGASKVDASAAVKDKVTSITFERRFTPGVTPQAETLKPGETLLGGQVMALAIDDRGAVKNCKIVATSGAVTPQYGCDEAAAEKFEASAKSGASASAHREGYLTIVVYGHSEQVV